MIERQKKEFAVLLEKMDAANEEKAPLSLNKIDQLFQEINSGYQKITCSMTSKREELNIISDILHHRRDSFKISRSNDNLHGLLIENTIERAKKLSRIDNFNKLKQFYIETGDFLFANHNPDMALEAWKSVLKENPGNEHIHNRLVEIIKSSNTTNEYASMLHGNYSFEYVGSFGHNIVKGPLSIAVSRRDDFIYVSDYIENKIHKFNSDEKYLGALHLTLGSPRGLFEDSEANIWICDYGNASLFVVNSRGKVIREIDLSKLADFTDGLVNPLSVGVIKEKLYLLLGDNPVHQRKLVSLNVDCAQDSLEVLSSDVVTSSGSIKCFEDKLYIFDQGTEIIYRYECDYKEFRPYIKFHMQEQIHSFTKFNDFVFLVGQKTVFKLMENGSQIFSASIDGNLGTGQLFFHDIESMENGKDHLLIVTDSYQRKIHKFIV